LTILIVEDDRHVRRILESLFVRDPEFAALEPRVLLAADGAEGLALLRAHRPDAAQRPPDRAAAPPSSATLREQLLDQCGALLFAQDRLQTCFAAAQ